MSTEARKGAVLLNSPQENELGCYGQIPSAKEPHCPQDRISMHPSCLLQTFGASVRRTMGLISRYNIQHLFRFTWKITMGASP